MDSTFSILAQLDGSLGRLFFPEFRLDFLRLGAGSANKSGALLAQLLVCGWWFALAYRKAGFGISSLLTVVLGAALLQTQSRGALVAVIVGLVLLAGFVLFLKQSRFANDSSTGIPLKRFGIRLIVLLLIGVLLGCYGHLLGLNDRISTAVAGDDGSVQVRFTLYEAGLKMLADNPQGWGSGKAADVYTQWYQPIGDTRRYLSLVNSHLTWLVQCGWLSRVAYIAAWCGVFALLWPNRIDRFDQSSGTDISPGVTRRRIIAFSVWATLAVSACFSSVLTFWGLWVLPGFLLFWALIDRLRTKQWPHWQTWAQTALGTVVIACVLWGSGAWLGRGDGITATRKTVFLEGEGTVSLAVISPDRRVLGDSYGHTLREFRSELGSVLVVDSTGLNGSPLGSFDVVMLSGKINEGIDLNLLPATRVILFNPDAQDAEQWLEVLGGRQAEIVLGSMGDWRRRNVWESIVEEHPELNMTVLPGVANYIPNWPLYALAPVE